MSKRKFRASNYAPLTPIKFGLNDLDNKNLKHAKLSPELLEFTGILVGMIKKLRLSPTKFRNLSKYAVDVEGIYVIRDWIEVYFKKGTRLTFSQMITFRNHIASRLSYCDKPYGWSGIIKNPRKGMKNVSCRFAIGPHSVRYGFPNVSPYSRNPNTSFKNLKFYSKF